MRNRFAIQASFSCISKDWPCIYAKSASRIYMSQTCDKDVYSNYRNLLRCTLVLTRCKDSYLLPSYARYIWYLLQQHRPHWSRMHFQFTYICEICDLGIWSSHICESLRLDLAYMSQRFLRTSYHARRGHLYLLQRPQQSLFSPDQVLPSSPAKREGNFNRYAVVMRIWCQIEYSFFMDVYIRIDLHTFGCCPNRILQL